MNNQIFKNNKRVKLGIWGLGRGRAFYNTCSLLNFDIVAGCDWTPHMREHFLSQNPGAFATGDADEFLARDIDAVLLATYCPAHADDAIRCLRAGKHVLSEVTSFHTMAEGVRLVEEVERAGKVYQLAENYPFGAANMWLAARWREGLFGELMYAEYEYVHEILSLSYTNLDNSPIEPGNQAHSWRSWLNFHYYNTHSLGPMMYITGLRPTRVVSLPGGRRLPGYLMQNTVGMGGIAPSLINMSNGSVVRNLMGATANDGHCQRIWGTNGAAQMVGHGLELRLGGRGDSPLLQVTPRWEEFSELAAGTGHGGGDFWCPYFFARQILEGTPGPFDIYAGSDCTIPGILAARSQFENGQAYDVPDFRDPAQREAWRHDEWHMPKYDYKNGLFPQDADKTLMQNFSRTMRDLIHGSALYRAYADWNKVAGAVVDQNQLVTITDRLIAALPALRETQQMARKIVAAYPDSDAAHVLGDMLTYGEVKISSAPAFERDLKRRRARLVRKLTALRDVPTAKTSAEEGFSPFARRWRLSRLLPLAGPLARVKPVKLTDPLGWRTIDQRQLIDGMDPNFVNVHARTGDADGVVYLAGKFRFDTAGAWTLHLGHDGGCKLFVDGKAVLCRPKRFNPATPDRSRVTVLLRKGVHEIVIALDTDAGHGWGIFFRFQKPRALRRQTGFPTSIH